MGLVGDVGGLKCWACEAWGGVVSGASFRRETTLDVLVLQKRPQEEKEKKNTKRTRKSHKTYPCISRFRLYAAAILHRRHACLPHR